MKKLLVFLLLTCACALGQTFSGYSGADTFVVPPWRMCFGDDPGAHNSCFSQSLSFDKTAYVRGQLDYEFTTITISQLPSASAVYNTGRVYWIKDGQSTADCTQGGGFSFVLCASNGTIWIPIGGGGGGGAPFLLRTNSPTTGTVLNELVEYDNSHLDANGIATVQLATSNSTKVIGICISNCGTTGIATIGTYLSANCISDNQSVVGDLVSAASTPGQCHDYGSTISSTVQTLGRVSKADAGGGTASLVDFFLGNILAPGSGGGTVTNCASGAGANAYYAAIGTVVSCDPLVTDDGAGNLAAKSYTANNTSYAGFLSLKNGPTPPATPANSTQFYVQSTISTPNAFQLPLAAGGADVGKAWGVTSSTTDANSNPVDIMGLISVGGGGGISTASALNPGQPTVTPGGTPGGATYSYCVVGFQDVNGVYHSKCSPIGTTNTGNATLSTTNYNLLAGYGDTLYGYRGFAICRTAGGATQGVLTGGLIAGKKFKDIGLTGDGTNCLTTYSVNTTILSPFCLGSASPGSPTTPGFPCGVDGPPLAPNALNDEMGASYDAPGGNTDGVWSWGGGGTSPCTQGSATAVWSGGTIVLTTDTTSQVNCLVLSTALPATPYTFKVWMANEMTSTNTSGETCLVGLRESTTGKMFTADIIYTNSPNTQAGNGGYLWVTDTWTTNAAFSHLLYMPFEPNAAYITIQNTGTNLVPKFSGPNDGVGFTTFTGTTVALAFGSAPDQLIIGGSGVGGKNATCVFDFERSIP